MHHKLIELPLRADQRGNLAFAQQGDQIPFEVKRVFYLYAIPEGSQRAGHAHREQHQFLIMLSGRCEVQVDFGSATSSLTLDSPQQALYVPPMHWLQLRSFTANSICLVLTSDAYSESDYLRARAEYDALMGASRSNR